MGSQQKSRAADVTLGNLDRTIKGVTRDRSTPKCRKRPQSAVRVSMSRIIGVLIGLSRDR